MHAIGGSCAGYLQFRHSWSDPVLRRAVSTLNALLWKGVKCNEDSLELDMPVTVGDESAGAGSCPSRCSQECKPGLALSKATATVIDMFQVMIVSFNHVVGSIIEDASTSIQILGTRR